MRESADGGCSDADQIGESLVDPGAFSCLFDRHAGSVHRYLSKRDLTYPDARPWLFGIATNLTRHHWRSEGRRLVREANHSLASVVGPDTSEEVAERLFFESQGTPIVEALATLDPGQRDVVLLVAGPGLSYEEISVALGIPVGTVRSRLARARRQLRELLGDVGQYLDVGHGRPIHSTLKKDIS
jgi:RNA polymerase sigma factor (sigma-70 family)